MNDLIMLDQPVVHLIAMMVVPADLLVDRRLLALIDHDAYHIDPTIIN
jgi:hypothetical protein